MDLLSNRFTVRKCDTCQRTFTSAIDFLIHTNTGHVEPVDGLFVCLKRSCRQKFKRRELLTLHVKRNNHYVSSPKSFLQTARLLSAGSVEGNCATKRDDSSVTSAYKSIISCFSLPDGFLRITCPLCATACTSCGQWLKHVSSRHRRASKELEQYSIVLLRCPYCSTAKSSAFSSCYELYCHLATHDLSLDGQDTNFSFCDVVGASFSSRRRSISHMESKIVARINKETMIMLEAMFKKFSEFSSLSHKLLNNALMTSDSATAILERVESTIKQLTPKSSGLGDNEDQSAGRNGSAAAVGNCNSPQSRTKQLLFASQSNVKLPEHQLRHTNDGVATNEGNEASVTTKEKPDESPSGYEQEVSLTACSTPQKQHFETETGETHVTRVRSKMAGKYGVRSPRKQRHTALATKASDGSDNNVAVTNNDVIIRSTRSMRGNSLRAELSPSTATPKSRYTTTMSRRSTRSSGKAPVATELPPFKRKAKAKTVANAALEAVITESTESCAHALENSVDVLDPQTQIRTINDRPIQPESACMPHSDSDVTKDTEAAVDSNDQTLRSFCAPDVTTSADSSSSVLLNAEELSTRSEEGDLNNVNKSKPTNINPLTYEIPELAETVSADPTSAAIAEAADRIELRQSTEPDNKATPLLDNEGTPLLDDEATPILDDERTPLLADERTPLLADETTPLLDNEGTPFLADERTPFLDEETTPVLNDEATPLLADGATHILDEETTPVLNDEATPLLADGATPLLDDEATPLPADEATPLLDDEATPLPADEATPLLDDEETHLDDEATPFLDDKQPTSDNSTVDTSTTGLIREDPSTEKDIAAAETGGSLSDVASTVGYEDEEGDILHAVDDVAMEVEIGPETTDFEIKVLIEDTNAGSLMAKTDTHSADVAAHHSRPFGQVGAIITSVNEKSTEVNGAKFNITSRPVDAPQPQNSVANAESPPGTEKSSQPAIGDSSTALIAAAEAVDVTTRSLNSQIGHDISIGNIGGAQPGQEASIVASSSSQGGQVDDNIASAEKSIENNSIARPGLLAAKESSLNSDCYLAIGKPPSTDNTTIRDNTVKRATLIQSHLNAGMLTTTSSRYISHRKSIFEQISVDNIAGYELGSSENAATVEPRHWREKNVITVSKRKRPAPPSARVAKLLRVSGDKPSVSRPEQTCDRVTSSPITLTSDVVPEVGTGTAPSSSVITADLLPSTSASEQICDLVTSSHDKIVSPQLTVRVTKEESSASAKKPRKFATNMLRNLLDTPLVRVLSSSTSNSKSLQVPQSVTSLCQSRVSSNMCTEVRPVGLPVLAENRTIESFGAASSKAILSVLNSPSKTTSNLFEDVLKSTKMVTVSKLASPLGRSRSFSEPSTEHAIFDGKVTLNSEKDHRSLSATLSSQLKEFGQKMKAVKIQRSESMTSSKDNDLSTAGDLHEEPNIFSIFDPTRSIDQIDNNIVRDSSPTRNPNVDKLNRQPTSWDDKPRKPPKKTSSRSTCKVAMSTMKKPSLLSSSPAIAVSGQATFTCTTCGKKFNEAAQYQQHTVMKACFNLPQCEYCFVTYSSERGLEEHRPSCRVKYNSLRNVL